MKAKELHKIAKSEFIELLCSGAIVYAKKDRSWQRQHLTVDNAKDPWFFTWTADGNKATAKSTIGIIIKTQLESWCIARENEGCSFYKTA